jgi:hypothetical protein
MAIDAKAAAEGIEAVAPMYGFPVPAKGTMSSVDYPGGAGLGILDGCYVSRSGARAPDHVADDHLICCSRPRDPHRDRARTTRRCSS